MEVNEEEDSWYYYDGSYSYGPLTYDVMYEYYRSGYITENTYVGLKSDIEAGSEWKLFSGVRRNKRRKLCRVNFSKELVEHLPLYPPQTCAIGLGMYGCLGSGTVDASSLGTQDQPNRGSDFTAILSPTLIARIVSYLGDNQTVLYLSTVNKRLCEALNAAVLHVEVEAPRPVGRAVTQLCVTLSSPQQTFPSLVSLNLVCAGLTDDSGDRLLRLLPSCTFCALLQRLDLSNNALGLGAAKALALLLPLTPALRELLLAANRLRGEGFAALSPGLPLCGALETLNLSSNHCAPPPPPIAVSASAAAAAAASATGAEGGGGGGGGGETNGGEGGGHPNPVAGVVALAGALPHCPSLHTLSVACNPLHHGAAAVGVAVTACSAAAAAAAASDAAAAASDGEVCSTSSSSSSPPQRRLVELSLESTRLTGSECSRVAEAVGATACFLTLLNLGGNPFGDIGAHALASAITSPSGPVHSLQRLLLPNCAIGDSGVLSLAVALPECSRLQVVDLEGNLIAGGGKWLADHLPRCVALSHLFLAHNKMEKDERSRLRAALRRGGGSTDKSGEAGSYLAQPLHLEL